MIGAIGHPGLSPERGRSMGCRRSAAGELRARPAHAGGSQCRKIGESVDGHEQIRLSLDGLDHMDHAGLAAQRQAVGIGPADADHAGPHGERLDHIGSGLDVGVEPDRNVATRADERGQEID